MTAALALKPIDVISDAARADDPGARAALADYWLELGREDVARLWLDRLPREETKWPRSRKRVDKLTKAQVAAMPEWAKRWIGIGLETKPADRPLFEAAVTACYRYTGLAAPRVIWCPSPIVVALAGPIAAHILRERGSPAAAVDSAVGSAVHSAVGSAVHSAVGSAVDSAVGSADQQVLLNAKSPWYALFGGQFWVGGWWWGSPSFVSFMTEKAQLRLERDIELRAQAYAATCMSACWWWPAEGHVFVSERPSRIDLAGGQLKLAQWDGWEVRR